MGFNFPDPSRTPVSTAYHLSVGRQSLALGGGASVAFGLGLAVEYLKEFLCTRWYEILALAP
ncbi:MAG: hypothetical protein JO235_21195 [Chroococcidiopsidaceae cyanobacterium CP_BM_RX_35]|nr:hypothetical protein [Chroococcidiopsidaceae cyanobacterium CP_BM_RX_35]